MIHGIEGKMEGTIEWKGDEEEDVSATGCP
jgi:hypothetical protein